MERSIEMNIGTLGISFANTANEHEPYMPKSLSECETYGMWYGCNEHCPVLIRGECELQEAENKDLYELVKKKYHG